MGKVPIWRTRVSKKLVLKKRNVPLIISDSEDEEGTGKDVDNEPDIVDSEGEKRFSAAAKKKKPVPGKSILRPVVEVPIKKVIPKVAKRPLPVSPDKQEGYSKKKAKKTTATQKRKEKSDPRKRPIPDLSSERRNEDEAVDSGIAKDHIPEVSGLRARRENDTDSRRRLALSARPRERRRPVRPSGDGPSYVA